jgi:hypothetical protein
VGLAHAGRAEEDHVLAPLDEAERMEALQLVALDRGLEAEVEVGQRLHRGQAGGAHRGLEPPLVPQGDVTPQQFGHRFPGRQLAAVAPVQDVIQGLERAGHLEIGELGAQPVAQGRGRHQRASATRPP